MSKKHKPPGKAADQSSLDSVPMSKKPKQTPRASKVSCLDAAAMVLKMAGKSLSTKAMIEAMSAQKLWRSDAPTPAATLYSAILRELKHKGPKARFKKTDRGLFALVARAGVK